MENIKLSDVKASNMQPVSRETIYSPAKFNHLVTSYKEGKHIAPIRIRIDNGSYDLQEVWLQRTRDVLSERSKAGCRFTREATASPRSLSYVPAGRAGQAQAWRSYCAQGSKYALYALR